MKAIILAGFSKKIEKDIQIISKQIKYLNYNGINNIYICTNINIKNLLKLSKNVKVINEVSPLQTGGAIRSVLSEFKNENEILIINGDTEIDIDINKMLDFHIKNQNELTILIKKVSNVSNYGSVTLGLNNIVEKYNEKLQHLNTNGYVNNGLYIINTEIIELLNNKTNVSLEKEIIPCLISLNRKIFGYIKNDN